MSSTSFRPLLYRDVADRCSLITEFRIQKRVEEQFTAFVTGFNELIPPDLVNVFDERELELLIGGIADIDIEDWKKHTDYRGYTESDEVIVNFWKVSYPPPPHPTRSSEFPAKYPLLTPLLFHTVYPQLGRRAEIPPPPVRNRHLPHPRQRLQGPPGQRRAAEIHCREVGRADATA